MCETATTGLAADGFSVIPISIVRSKVSTNHFEAEYDRSSVFKLTQDFESVSISESVRNVYQHGHPFRTHDKKEGIIQGAHAAIALKELRIPSKNGELSRVLLVSVMDSGPGIQDPAYQLVDGNGAIGRGENHCGMGHELKHSLIYIVRSTRPEWLVFDGVRYSELRNWPQSVDQWLPESRHTKIAPEGKLDLPRPPHPEGCQKILFCYTKDSTPEERASLREIILDVLSEKLKPA
jgi:hypothetical protein